MWKPRLTVALLSLLLLSGCTTLKDFQQMDASNRASFVCNREHQVQQHQSRVSELESKIEESLQTLERGYRVHKSCRTVFIDQPDVKCTTVEQNNQKTTTCEQITRTLTREVCHEIPVTIDADLEKEHLQQYRTNLEQAEIEKSTAYYNCYSRIEPMSAEEAFQHYQSR